MRQVKPRRKKSHSLKDKKVIKEGKAPKEKAGDSD